MESHNPSSFEQKVKLFRQKRGLPSLVLFSSGSSGSSPAQISLGYSDLSTKKEVDEKTLYHIGSLTKLFTANLVSNSILEGKIKLETLLKNLYPGELSDYPAGKISILSLLTHTSGLGKNIYLHGEKKIDNLEKVISSLIKIPKKFFSNKKVDHKDLRICYYCYSNAGYAILRHVLETIYPGETYYDLLKKIILDPFEMKDTKIYSDEENVAIGYLKVGRDEKTGSIRMKRFKDEEYCMKYGGGSLMTNFIDFKKYLDAYSSNTFLSECRKEYLLVPLRKINKEKITGKDSRSLSGHGKSQEKSIRLGLAWEYHKGFWTKDGIVPGFYAFVCSNSSGYSFCFTNTKCEKLSTFLKKHQK